MGSVGTRRDDLTWEGLGQVRWATGAGSRGPSALGYRRWVQGARCAGLPALAPIVSMCWATGTRHDPCWLTRATVRRRGDGHGLTRATVRHGCLEASGVSSPGHGRPCVLRPMGTDALRPLDPRKGSRVTATTIGLLRSIENDKASFGREGGM